MAATPRQSAYRWLYDAVLKKQVSLVLTTEILNEYEEKLGEFYAPDFAEAVLNTLLRLPNIILINPIYYRWNLITVDPDDNKFVDAHIAASADYTITHDNHFKILETHPFPIVKCLKMDAFQPLLAAHLINKK
jgi:uncharacterized protein